MENGKLRYRARIATFSISILHFPLEDNPMYNVKLYNKISKVGLDDLDPAKYTCSEDFTDYDAVLVRSAKLHDVEFPKNLRCIARAGAGVNNIPIDRCSEEGIVVFNTPVQTLTPLRSWLSAHCCWPPARWYRVQTGLRASRARRISVLLQRRQVHLRRPGNRRQEAGHHRSGCDRR